MKTIFALTDYKGRFGSKYDAVPYRSGLNKDLLSQFFRDNSFKLEYIPLHEVNFRKNDMIGAPVMYTSQEDFDSFYKNYIEDIVYGLELTGANVIPPYKYLKAHNNKIFMEILRDQLPGNESKNIFSQYYGTLEEVLQNAENITYPVVIKEALGSMSKGVFLAKDKSELIKKIKEFGYTSSIRTKFHEYGRIYKHEGYIKESDYRRKFLTQNFIEGLREDWKILIYGDKYFIFNRPILKHRGFRASGGGAKHYFYGINANIPDGIFDFAKTIYKKLDVPMVSVDVAFKNGTFYLLEFQVVYFGTVGVVKSKEYFVQENGNWISKENTDKTEKLFSDSIVNYLNQKG